MSCQGNFLSNAVCAAKSGISGVASKSASVAGNVGQAYAGQMKKNVETAKNVGRKAAGAYAGQVKKNVGAYKDAGQAIAGAARSLGGFYKSQFRENSKTAVAAVKGARAFAKAVDRAEETANEALSGVRQEVDEATEAFDEGARKQRIGLRGGAKVAVLGGLVHTMAQQMTGSHLHGAFWGTVAVTKSVAKAKDGLYARTPEGKVALARVEAAVEKLEAARKEVAVDYRKTILGEARRFAGKLKAARMEA